MRPSTKATLEVLVSYLFQIVVPISPRALYLFEGSLRELGASKSAKKRQQKYSGATRAGCDLPFAFSSMKARMETEEKGVQFFYINDHIFWPHHLGKNFQVPGSYRWRNSADGSWNNGSKIFHHEYDVRPNYTVPQLRESQVRRSENRTCRKSFPGRSST